MPPVPILPSREILRALKRAGFVQRRQNGSHVVMEHPVSLRVTVVPRHNPVKAGTLKSILRKSGLSLEEFLELL